MGPIKNPCSSGCHREGDAPHGATSLRNRVVLSFGICTCTGWPVPEAVPTTDGAPSIVLRASIPRIFYAHCAHEPIRFMGRMAARSLPILREPAVAGEATLLRAGGQAVAPRRRISVFNKWNLWQNVIAWNTK